MNKAILVVASVAMLAAWGCTSPEGGQVGDKGFKIAVPMFGATVQQGETKDVTVSLKRDKDFKQDVNVELTASEGISVEPTRVTVPAEDTPDIHLRITAPKDAALGDYNVHIKGTPQEGQPTSIDLKVKVKAP